MATYSFLDFVGAIVGPGGGFPLGSGSGNAEEGVTITMTEEKDTMTVGADGSYMHSLHAGKSGKMTVRLLKTSPTNALLSTMYGFQTTSSQFHGINVLTFANPATGDLITGQGAAFAKLPNLTYAKDGGTNEWEFNVGKIDMVLGTGAAVAS